MGMESLRKIFAPGRFARLLIVSLLGMAVLPSPLTAGILFAEAPLIEAITEQDADRVHQELLRGANPNLRDIRGRPALALAASLGNAEIVSHLIDSSAIIDLPDKMGNTPLMLAAALGNFDAARLMLLKGADPNLANRNGETALMRTAQGGHLLMGKLLLAAGADRKIADYTGRTAAEHAQLNNSRNMARLLTGQTIN